MVAPDNSSALSSAVQTTGVSNSGASIEVRPLAGNVNSNNSISSTLNKTSPRGDKRPYSEANYAELQKADSLATTLNSTSVTAATPVIVTPVQKNEPAVVKPAAGSATNVENEALEWIWPSDGKLIAGFDEVKIKVWTSQVNQVRMCWLQVPVKSCMRVAEFAVTEIW